MSKNLSKKQMADKLGYEYIGKGHDNSCDDGFIVREYGTTNYKIIGKTQEQAFEWLLNEIEQLRENERQL